MADERTVDFGTFLRQARETRGISLQQVSIATKISSRVLDALERNDPSKLPGGIFSRSFVRSYAREVGLDPEVAVANFVSAFPEESGAEDMPDITTADEAETFESRRRVATTVVQLIVISLVILVLGLIYYATRGKDSELLRPARQPSPAEATPAPREPTGAPSAAAGAPSAPADDAVAPDIQAVAAADVPPATHPAPVTPTDAAPAVRQEDAGGAAAPLVVGLTMSDACWLSISVDGNTMPSRNFSAGERVEYQARRSVTMTVGNAGALAVTLNGKPARPLGSAGQVVTTTITADTFQSFLRQP